MRVSLRAFMVLLYFAQNIKRVIFSKVFRVPHDLLSGRWCSSFFGFLLYFMDLIEPLLFRISFRIVKSVFRDGMTTLHCHWLTSLINQWRLSECLLTIN